MWVADPRHTASYGASYCASHPSPNPQCMWNWTARLCLIWSSPSFKNWPLQWYVQFYRVSRLLFWFTPASQASTTPAGGQMAAVVSALNRMLRENKLLMAMDEVMSLRKYAKTTHGVQLKVLDSKGIVKATVSHGQYEFVVRALIYPPRLF